MIILSWTWRIWEITDCLSSSQVIEKWKVGSTPANGASNINLFQGAVYYSQLVRLTSAEGFMQCLLGTGAIYHNYLRSELLSNSTNGGWQLWITISVVANHATSKLICILSVHQPIRTWLRTIIWIYPQRLVRSLLHLHNIFGKKKSHFLSLMVTAKSSIAFYFKIPCQSINFTLLLVAFFSFCLRVISGPSASTLIAPFWADASCP